MKDPIEHETVSNKRAYPEVPADSVGVIVHIYPDATYCEVEFFVGGTSVVQTACIDNLQRHSKELTNEIKNQLEGGTDS